ncbi:hypothetical protein H6G06_06125 [Anabaena sphaerica FACHB-251]|uniref:Response regulatory domain-containing protein n=1 Tax=Anabaena sphaerica FACHB-251 TaxID=2692883 RepID=A0A926WF96_9NOST|nr:hypothetical protein [Anabaena sphaerica]MBD2293072.1 hypothetical protein [Anabaena sphaerica FACHB-251]
MTRIKVLIIEHAKLTTAKIKEIINRSNILEIIEAKDGQTGIELLTENADNLALIIVGLYLPKINGKYVIEYI